MTIILSAWCPEFGVLAVDRLQTGPGVVPEHRIKLVVHPAMPIAIATAGISTFLHPDAVRDVPEAALGRLPTTHVQTVLEDALSKYAGEPDAFIVAKHFAEWLHPAYLAICRVNRLDPDRKGGKIQLAVLAARDGRVTMQAVELGAKIAPPPAPKPIFSMAPACTELAIDNYLDGHPQMRGPQHVLDVLYGAYAVACKQQGFAVAGGIEPQMTIGGLLDAVIIDADGIHRLEALPAPADG